jgi:cell division protease FtsH
MTLFLVKSSIILNKNLIKIEQIKKYPHSILYNKKMATNFNNTKETNNIEIIENFLKKKSYPLSKNYYESNLKRLNSKNISEQMNEILGNFQNNERNKSLRITISPLFNQLFGDQLDNNYNDFEDDYHHDDFNQTPKKIVTINNGFGNRITGKSSKTKKSDNFEVVQDHNINFTSIGGYDSIKKELLQCIDLLNNYTKYSKYNVRIPKGLIFEGPPGNGKTLLAKALAGEANCSFIPVSGSQFQEMYVGVGSSRVRELFELAKKNIPCIIFIDEIDALGRNRGSDKETSSAERDSTLNELLVALDGFKTQPGIFLVGATNRADLLDPALLRPGRIDKRIFIGNPDEIARNSIIKIHSEGKPRETSISIDDLVETTNGFSAAQIENLLNEAMLNALRENRDLFTQQDLDVVYNRVLVGWQPTEHIFTSEMLDKICIHEMGHAVVGLLSRNHTKVKKVIINLSSPNSPGYTLFEKSNTNIYNRESLFEHLIILLGGRIAEELFYGSTGVTTGAISDFEEAFTLANKMITYYGMGEKAIYPSNSEKYKELIDNEISKLIQEAFLFSSTIIHNSKDFIYESAVKLKEKRLLTATELMETIETKYPEILDICLFI